MIPDFDENGNLPPGVYFCNWAEFKEQFGYNLRRQTLIIGLQEVLAHLKAAGCRSVYINGSFVTSQSRPKDFDMCWDRDDIDIDYLRQNAHLILNSGLFHSKRYNFKKITEKELAALTRLTEEQIRKYENKDYQNASFDTVIEVANALGIKLQHCIVISDINDFLNGQLMEVRQYENVDAEIKAVS